MVPMRMCSGVTYTSNWRKNGDLVVRRVQFRDRASVTRRTVLGFGAGALVTPLVPPFPSAHAQGPQRPFAWRDAADRTRIYRIVESLFGQVAIEATRPLSATGRFGGRVSAAHRPRAQIWLMDRDFAVCELLEPHELQRLGFEALVGKKS
jgi:hypothetical protein